MHAVVKILIKKNICVKNSHVIYICRQITKFKRKILHKIIIID